ncbi:MAG: ATP-grasp domain-containing protein [Methanolobus sp.]
MCETTILLTSAGVATACNVISALRNQKEKDIRIVSVDLNPLAAGLYLSDSFYTVPRSTDPEFIPVIIDICRKESVDMVLPLHSSETIVFSRNIDKFHDEGITLQLSNPEAIEKCVDKLSFHRFMDKNNFPCPLTYLPGEVDEELISGKIEFPLFLKPRSGSSSKNSFKVDNKKELDFYVNSFPESIVQEFVPGIEYTVDILADSNSNLVAAIPRERIEVKDGKAVKCRTVKDEAIISLSTDLIKKIGLSGPANIQIIKSGDKLKVIEINPRFAAGGLPLSTAAGVNIPLLLIKMLLGEKIQMMPEFKENLYMIRYLTEIFLQPDTHNSYRLSE